jgi:hypothetical protein
VPSLLRLATALLAVALLGVETSGCGNRHAASDSSPSTTPARSAANPIRSFGTAASPADYRAIATLLSRYYAAAATGSGTAGCALTYYILAESVSEEYGGPPGPQYLRGAATCQAILSRVFDHFHTQLTEAPRVTGVRVKGNLAYALLSWAKLPAGYMPVRREGPRWRIDRVLAAPLY